MAEVNWAKVHGQNESWRTRLIGDLSCSFVMPRYAELFEKYLGTKGKCSFLELGAGNGEMASLILQRKPPFIGSYTVSENFEEGVAWLKKKGLTAVLADAEQIPFPDASFDVVLCFDVMHHVRNPSKMAAEMMRTARGRLFFTESNGLSLGRKLMELTPGHRRAGERSYTPARYRSFFEQRPYRVTHFEIHPFVFPLRLPARISVPFNRWIENVPFIKWQCSNVYMYIEYERLDH